MKHRATLAELRHHRFELFLAILLVVSSIPYVLRRSPPPMSIDSLLPDVVRYTWGLVLLLGALGVAVGLVFCLPRVEFIGLMFLSWPAIVYAVMVVIFNANIGQGGRAGFPAVLALVMALFCLDRALELWRFGA